MSKQGLLPLVRNIRQYRSLQMQIARRPPCLQRTCHSNVTHSPMVKTAGRCVWGSQLIEKRKMAVHVALYLCLQKEEMHMWRFQLRFCFKNRDHSFFRQIFFTGGFKNAFPFFKAGWNSVRYFSRMMVLFSFSANSLKKLAWNMQMPPLDPRARMHSPH